MPLVGIVILNFNGNKDTLECFQSIDKWLSHGEFQFRIFLIDNASNTPLADSEIENFTSDIVYIKNKKNYGFAEGNNIGITKAVEHNCDYVILLNNDTVIVDDSLQKSLKYMQDHSGVGVCGLINYYYDDENTVWQAGFKTDFVKGINRPVPMELSSSVEFCEADYVPGSAFIIRRDVIDKIGGLEKDCFAYYEDIDYCIRTKQAGYTVGFYFNSRILHKVGKSSTSYIKEYLRTRNKLSFYSKYSRKNDFRFIYLTSLRQSLVRAMFKKGNKFKLFKSHALAFWDFHHHVFEEGSIGKLR